MQTLRTPDGLPLHLARWDAAAAARGTVLVVHGLGEHIGRYEAVARRLNDAGWRVVGHDQRGHGASGGDRGRLADDTSLLQDLALVIDATRERVPGPLVLLGHSMGGLVAARFVAEGLAPTPAKWWRRVDALVLSSPALAADTTGAQRATLAVLGRLSPDLAVHNGLQPQWISRDPAVVQAYMADPLVHDRITPRLARFILDGGDLVRSRAADWTTPTLLMWAGADRCVAPRGSAEFAAAAPGAVVHSREWPGLAHEIFNEPERDEVLAELVRWLGARHARVGTHPPP
jgi:alpha-beta hydrolase superfamily lysophospholipase